MAPSSTETCTCRTAGCSQARQLELHRCCFQVKCAPFRRRQQRQAVALLTQAGECGVTVVQVVKQEVAAAAVGIERTQAGIPARTATALELQAAWEREQAGGATGAGECELEGSPMPATHHIQQVGSSCLWLAAPAAHLPHHAAEQHHIAHL